MPSMKRIAVIGAGPAGAIAIDALARENFFDVIKVFERREEGGGCWLQDPPGHRQQLPDIDKLAARIADAPLTPPVETPCTMPSSSQYRFSDTSIYPHLETNIDAAAMSFSQEPIPAIRSSWSMKHHGHDTPFRHWQTVQDYLLGLLSRNNYASLISYSTTVERVQKSQITNSWILTLRRPLPDNGQDHWWTEEFDAVIVASGHYTVPFIPSIPGLSAFAARHPSIVTHSKSFRDPEAHRHKRVITVGASISGPDIASSLAGIAQTPLHCVVRGKYHPYFFDYAFQHPAIVRRPPISHFDSTDGARTVYFEDGTNLSDVDAVIFGTGYTWTIPFLEGAGIGVRNNRVPGLYQHVFWREDPSLCFVGALAAGFTFKVFEWQAVLCARFLAGRITLPPALEQERWEAERIEKKGDGVPFTALYPYFEEYFEEIRALAGEPVVVDGEETGRRLPKFEKQWRIDFDSAHLKRIEMWKRRNEEARSEMKRNLIEEKVLTGENETTKASTL